MLHTTPGKNLPTTLDNWWHSAPSDPCLDAEFTSYCQLEDVLVGDLEAAGELERISRLRSWRKEIVFTAVDARGIQLAINWVLSLRAQGIDHSLVITDSPTLCKALFYSDARISCAWTSFLSRCVLTQCCSISLASRSFTVQSVLQHASQLHQEAALCSRCPPVSMLTA
jgi:hypothetical protein